MKPIQLILIFILVALVTYARRLRTQLIDRAVIALVLMGGIVFVLFPDFANDVANAVGVGRGADLFAYLGLLGSAFAVLVLYTKMRQLEEQLTRLVRRQAIAEARGAEPTKTEGS